MSDDSFLGFIDRRTGVPVCVRAANRDAGGIGGDGYDLTDSGHALYRADEVDDLIAVVAGRIPSYNQTAERPGLGAFDAADLVPARVRIATTFEALDLASEATPFFDNVSHRRVPPAVAFQHVPCLRGLVDRTGACTMLMGTLKDGEIEPLSLVGRVVGSGSEDYPTKRTVLAAVPVPEEFVDLVDGERGLLLVCREDAMPSEARTEDLRLASETVWDSRDTGVTRDGPVR